MLFLRSLSLLLFLTRKKVPQELLLLTITWMLLQFYSSQISLPFFNLFQGLARLFPVLLRARGIRTEYILLLLFFAISAFGFSYFFRRFRKKKIVLALVLLLVFAERIRWPVSTEKLKDYQPFFRTLYQPITDYPDHFGLLELPFYPQNTNFYSLFTIFHNKHTYHGNIYYLSDYCDLNGSPQLQAESGFSGLSDPQFTQMLKAKGIRLILLFKDKICRDPNEGQKNWWALNGQIEKGISRGLFDKVEKTNYGTLLVLSEREQGEKIRYFLPRYSLIGKKNLVCTLNTNRESTADFIFNESPVKHQQLQPESQNNIVINLQNVPLALQFNYLEIHSGPSLELLRVRIE